MYNEKTGVHYPLAVTVGKPIETKKIAERLAQISTVSKADVAAVLAELPGVLADYMAQGKSVRLEGLGTFRYTLNTEGVPTREEMDFQKQVKAVRVQFTPARKAAPPRAAPPPAPSSPQASNGSSSTKTEPPPTTPPTATAPATTTADKEPLAKLISL